jgi:hypothetical protein
MSMSALANSPLFWVALITGLLVLYVLPSLIGAIRKVEGLGWLIAFNMLFPGIGWLAGMILAFTLPRRERAVPYRPVYYLSAGPRPSTACPPQPRHAQFACHTASTRPSVKGVR